ncbi:MAG: UDP-2,3-diacylglucosamine diphosphatase LpxI [Candidatus Omnitrophota bacterium]|nr:MAG: UDP-2,3-diacylglucosamine diphosphatase LpxI [Candidatus Omnitrophota bacterium]
MRLGLIAGNRLLPIILSRKIKEKNKDCEVVAVCFKGETLSSISKYVDKAYWIKVGELAQIRQIMKKEKLSEWIMAGQINPMRIFKRRNWDRELLALVEKTEDFRPHTIFFEIISYLEKEGIKFLDSTLYLEDYMSQEGVMNGLPLDREQAKDIEFGVKVACRYVDLDVGQTLVVKRGGVVALESLEGTNATILRGARLAGRGSTVLKFSKTNQDLRFDVPVVGISTLKLLKRVGASACVLEQGKVIILEKPKFLSLSKKWKIPIVGREKLPL